MVYDYWLILTLIDLISFYQIVYLYFIFVRINVNDQNKLHLGKYSDLFEIKYIFKIKDIKELFELHSKTLGNILNLR